MESPWACLILTTGFTGQDVRPGRERRTGATDIRRSKADDMSYICTSELSFWSNMVFLSQYPSRWYVNLLIVRAIHIKRKG